MHASVLVVGARYSALVHSYYYFWTKTPSLETSSLLEAVGLFMGCTGHKVQPEGGVTDQL